MEQIKNSILITFEMQQIINYYINNAVYQWLSIPESYKFYLFGLFPYKEID